MMPAKHTRLPYTIAKMEDRIVARFSEHWVESRPLAVPGQASSCFVRGKFDTVVRFDDGGFGVVDIKTSAQNSEHIPLYARQLHAYACALEQAAPGRLALSPVRRLGLLVYESRLGDGFSSVRTASPAVKNSE
jgi:ATP-dependent exoDNAse (exonuclease V) beta subunit